MKALLLDFYGTLAHEAEPTSFDAILARHGYSLPDDIRQIWWSGDIDGIEHIEQSRTRDRYVAWQRERLLGMLAQADVHPGEYELILSELHEGRSTRVLQAYPEVPGVLEELRERGHLLVVCSNWDWDLEPAVEEAGLAGLVDVLVSSAWAGARKPHPRIFRHALEQIDVAPADVLFVGDTWGPDVEGPMAVGMTPVYLERDGHWPDPTQPAADAAAAVNTNAVARICDLRGVLELL
ncbi:MAG TPA: HAD family hydrolase [Acidimicrobiia bacterium]